MVHFTVDRAVQSGGVQRRDTGERAAAEQPTTHPSTCREPRALVPRQGACCVPHLELPALSSAVSDGRRSLQNCMYAVAGLEGLADPAAAPACLAACLPPLPPLPPVPPLPAAARSGQGAV